MIQRTRSSKKRSITPIKRKYVNAGTPMHGAHFSHCTCRSLAVCTVRTPYSRPKHTSMRPKSYVVRLSRLARHFSPDGIDSEAPWPECARNSHRKISYVPNVACYYDLVAYMTRSCHRRLTANRTSSPFMFTLAREVQSRFWGRSVRNPRSAHLVERARSSYRPLDQIVLPDFLHEVHTYFLGNSFAKLARAHVQST